MNLPDFFSLDMGSHSIKVAQIDRKSVDEAELLAFGSVETPFGILTNEDVVAKKRLSGKLKEAVDIANIKSKRCVAALPEASIFTRLITVPKVEESKLEELIYWEARQYIPIPLANVQLDYILIEEKEIQGKKMLQLLLVAAPKILVKRHMDLISQAGFELLALETETIASSRALTFGNDLKENFLIIDFGANGTDMSVVRKGAMIFSQSLGTGSDAMTKAIASDFNLEMSQAEQYKIKFGLDKTQAEGKIYKSIEPIAQIITDEINRTVNFFRTHLRDSMPQKMLLVGDGAKLKNLDEYLSAKLSFPVELVNPAKNLKINKKIQAEAEKLNFVGYTVAIGLALKNK